MTPQPPRKSLIEIEVIEPASIAPIREAVKRPEDGLQGTGSSTPSLIQMETLEDTSPVIPQSKAQVVEALATRTGAGVVLPDAEGQTRSAAEHYEDTPRQDNEQPRRGSPEVTTQPPRKAAIEVEIIEPVSIALGRNTGKLPDDGLRRADSSTSPLIHMEMLEDTDLVNPKPEMPVAETQSNSDDLRKDGHRGIGWLLGLVLIGVVGLTLVGMAEWILGLLEHLPVLGVPAALAATALGVGAVALIVREVRALRRLRDVEQVRSAWGGADGERLRSLILRVGGEIGDTAGTRRAADLVDDAGPDRARKLLSSEVLAPRDLRAAAAVASAVRQGALIVVASPSPFLDVILLLGLATRLLRQIAWVYGYRPSTLVLRSLLLSAWRDAGAIVVADVLAQEVTQSVPAIVEKAGQVIKAAGSAAAITGFGVGVGVTLGLVGAGVSAVATHALGSASGPLGAGAATAWRIYRFGLIVLVSARPLPFDPKELKDIKASTRAKVFHILGTADGPASREASDGEARHA